MVNFQIINRTTGLAGMPVALTRISGGTLGSDYSLTCTLTFTSGQILPCVILVQVRER